MNYGTKRKEKKVRENEYSPKGKDYQKKGIHGEAGFSKKPTSKRGVHGEGIHREVGSSSSSLLHKKPTAH